MKRGFYAPCPKCGDNGVAVYLDEVSHLRCLECNEDMDLDLLRKLVAGWGPVIAWLDSAPALEE